jgi:ABC-2 type transport system permease protein
MIRRFGWALKRELWEISWIWLAPSGIAVVLILGFAAYALHLPAQMTAAATLDAAHQRQALLAPYDIVAGFLMIAGLLVAIIYCVDALYGERRDRSILLWKSLPVSDAVTVLAKLCIPVLVVPVVIWALTVTVHVAMLLTSTAILAANGQSASILWSELHLLPSSLGLLYHLVVVHGILTAPLYAWLLLVSAWATRAPLAWAILPPIAIGFLERVAFGTTRFGDLVLSSLGAGPGNATAPVAGATLMDSMVAVPVTRLLGAPALWVGLVVAAMFVVGAVRLRRSAQPI